MPLYPRITPRGKATRLILAFSLIAGSAHAVPPAFIDLHAAFPTAQDSTNVKAVTPDGRFAVGYVDFGAGLSNRAAVWDLSTGTGTLLPEPAGVVSGTTDAFGISDDGTVITGSGAMGSIRVTIRWTNGVPSVVSGSDWTDNFGVSGDGQVAVGRTRTSSGQWLASRWTQSGGVLGMQPQFPGESPSTALDASFDGSVVAGVSRGVIVDPIFGGLIENFATTWDTAGVPQRLTVGGEIGSWANKVSPDGRYAVGNAVTGTGLRTAIRWDRQTGESEFVTRTFSSSLSTMGNPNATAITPDGSIVAANTHDFGFSSPTALWSEETGLVDLKELLETQYGLDLTGWTLALVADMTTLPDGSIVVVGEGNFESIPGDPFTRERHSYMAVIPALVGQAEAVCDPLWDAPAALSNPGLTDSQLDSDPVHINDLVPFAGELYALGDFVRAGGNNIGFGIARWNGSQWSPAGVGLGGTAPSARVGEVFDDGSGEALYVGGFFPIAGGQFIEGLARWNGSQWSPVGNANLNNGVTSMVVHDDGSGPALYIGGAFTSVAGIQVRGLARWDGSAWSSIGSPVGGTLDIGPRSMAVYDDGSGPALYISGPFQTVDGVAAQGIAKWDGSAWSPVGGGLTGWAELMTVYDDGSGPALYLVGGFSAAGGSPMSGLIRWNGQQYQPIAQIQGTPADLKVLDLGAGPVLAVSISGGTYTDGVTSTEFPVAGGLLAWNGQILARVGLPNEGYAGFFNAGKLAEFDDGSGPAIYIGGDFDVVYTSSAPSGAAFAGNIARIIPCQSTPTCAADTNLDGILTPADFTAWIAAFNAQSPQCDQNSDGSCSPADFTAWIANFNAGCD